MCLTGDSFSDKLKMRDPLKRYEIVPSIQFQWIFTIHQQVRIQRGGDRGPDLPGKSQIIWVSTGNKQLDPPPGKSWTPLENVGPPLEP